MDKKIKDILTSDITRRSFLLATAGLTAGYFIGKSMPPGNGFTSYVAVVKVPKYSLNIKDMLRPYFNKFELQLKGKSVLLKPNIIEYLGNDRYITTNPAIVEAAIQLFLDIGARVTVGEASGFKRDLSNVLYHTQYIDMLKKYNIQFIDLNFDYIEKVQNITKFNGLEHLFIPQTVLNSDFIVSMPKLKTHHWMGVTISLKNMFGIMPGLEYGWPKNKLHTAGVERSILDINYTVRPNFTIVDGVYGIEGNGPIFGTNRHLGVVVMSNDLLAADSVCSKIIGVNPEKVDYLKLASLQPAYNIAPLGTMNYIKVLGENISNVKQDFKLLNEFSHLRN